jgi:hypothetical protein
MHNRARTVNMLRYSSAVLLIATAALTSGCKARDEGLKTPPPPPGGFKNEKRVDRHDDAGGKIDVYIALGDTAPIVNSSTPPTSDVALGWISNSGSKKEKVYGFRPNDKANYTLYARSQSNGGGWRIEEDPVGGGPTDPNWKTGQFVVCDTHPAAGPDVGFKNCGAESSTAATMTKSSMTGGFFNALFGRVLALILKPATDPLDAPGWVACTDGCCTW